MTASTNRRKVIIALFGWLLFLAIAYSCLSLIRHAHFQSGGFDLGIYDQTIWQNSQFIFPYNTIKEKLILADHLTLTLPLLAPLYWIWNDVRILLIFQAFWVSFSSLAIFLYLAKRGLNNIQSLILTFLYGAFYGIQYGVSFDFHPSSIGLGLLAWVLFFWESQKWKAFAAAVILLLLTQENMGIALLGLCSIWIFQRKHIKLTFILAGISIVYTCVSINIVNILSSGGYEYVAQLPMNLIEFVNRLFDDEQKRQVWFYSFSWFSFVPLFSPGALIASFIDNSQYFVTGEQFNRMWSPFTHHRFNLAIYLVVGAADVLLFIKKTKKLNITIITVLMLGIALLQQYTFHLPLNKLSKPEFWMMETWVSNNNAVLSKIPKNTSVATQQSFVPHLSHRKNIYLAYPRKHFFATDRCGQRECWWLDFGGNPELLVVDVHNSAWSTMLLEEVNNFKEALVNMENAKVIQLIYQKGEAGIYKIDDKALESIK